MRITSQPAGAKIATVGEVGGTALFFRCEIRRWRGAVGGEVVVAGCWTGAEGVCGTAAGAGEVEVAGCVL